MLQQDKDGIFNRSESNMLPTNKAGNAVPPPLEADTLRERIITREGTTPVARASLTKCAIRFRDFTERVTSFMSLPGNDVYSIEIAGDILKRELQLYSLEMDKVSLAAQASDTELAHYISSQLDIESSIAACIKEIEKLKKKLIHENLVKKYREEYEALAKIAIIHPARRESGQELTKVRKEMELVDAKQMQIRMEMEIKKKQFHLLMQSICDLNSSLFEENERSNEI